MKISAHIPIFLTVCSGCIRQPVMPYDRYNTSAMLNDSIWFATGQAVEQTNELAKPCVSHRFDLFVRTDIPYPGFPGKGLIQDAITGCVQDCRASQLLSFYNIPLKKGKYKIAKLDRCGLPFSDDYHHVWIGYSGGIVVPFYLRDSKSGWIWVTRYEPEAKIIVGRFKGEFADSTGRLTQFRRGSFRIELQSRKNVVNE